MIQMELLLAEIELLPIIMIINVLGNEKGLCTEECSVFFYLLCFATIMNCSIGVSKQK